MSEQGEHWRLFVAVVLPDSVLAQVGRVQERLQGLAPERAARWVRPEGIHITLKFLGDAPVSQLDALRAALDAAVEGHSAFELYAAGLGAFPHTKQPRVLWIGLSGDIAELNAVRESVEERISPLGFPTEKRDFHPHLTLARAARGASRADQAALGELVDKIDLPRLVTWRVEGISLIRSDLGPGGAQYTQVHLAPLGS